jgi:hypothetical protein
MKRAVGVVAIVFAYLAGVNLAWSAAQIRVWNYFNWVDMLVMVTLVAPFLAARWIWQLSLRSTRTAWILAALMAVDIPLFLIMTLVPGGGHPSLEAVVFSFTGLLRIALVPAALVALCMAFSKGERAFVIMLGVICLVCDSVYIVPGPDHPFRWLLVRDWITDGSA